MVKLKFGNLTYISEKPYELNKGIRIEYETPIPVEVHKFYSPSNYSFQAITESKFYCSHPYQFNDITDSNPLSFNFDNLSFEDYKALFQNELNDEELKELYVKDKETKFSAFRNLHFSLITQKLGTICLTSDEMNNLMWGHYSSDSGFRIKFDTQKLLESINNINDQNCLIFPINYIEDKLHIDVNKLGFHLPLLVDISTKIKHWQYENEWRIVISKNDMNVPHSLITPHLIDYTGKDDRFIKYDPESILEIVFGMNFFNGTNVESIQSISNTENHITIKNKNLSDFLDFVSDNLQGKMVHAGLFIDEKESYFEGTAPIKRSIEKIEIKKIDKNIFSLIRTNPGVIRTNFN